MPSVRVRRGSQYRAIGGDDGPEQQASTSGRPRSRTITSMYRSEGTSQDDSPSVGQLSPRRRRSDTEAEDTRSDNGSPYDSRRRLSKIEDSILSRKRSSNAVRGQRSLEPLWRRPESMEGQVLHGSQADIMVPGDGRPGRLESALSLTSSGEGEENPFHSSSESLNHDDDIVEHLEVIGESSQCTNTFRYTEIIFLKDPQISTISSLTNAANSIMM